jgi:glycosyltransferase involved in cell wall biosynthesis
MFVMTGQMSDYRNPEYINKLKNMMEQATIASHIKLLGFIDREEQIAVMKNAKYVIQPSLFEGWGTVVEDAKVLDKTVLLSDISIHREQKNDKCILFDPYSPEKLAELIAEENQKEHIDDMAVGILDMYKRAKEYSKGFEELLKN